MIELGSTLSNLASICLRKSTETQFKRFTEADKDLLEKIGECVVDGHSILPTRNAVVDETFIQKSANLCKSKLGIDASQLYLSLMFQPMTTGLYTRWAFHPKTNRLTARKKTRSFQGIVMS